MSRTPETTSWYVVYHELALLLQDFYKTHNSQAGYELFKLLNRSRTYKINNSWLSKVDQNEKRSVEPIQLFTSFNRLGQSEDIRTDIINSVWRQLNPEQKPPWGIIEFHGCPLIMGIKLLHARPVHQTIEIWQAFAGSMVYGQAWLTPALWTELMTWRGIQMWSFSVFLFWINSEVFLPLDKNTKKYLEHLGFLPPGIRITPDIYRVLLENKKIIDYRRLALEAYYFNSGLHIQEEEFDRQSNVNNVEIANTGFKFVGLRTLGRNKAVHKILSAYQYYPIDKTIYPEGVDLQSPALIKEFKENVEYADSLYNLENLNVNITAIVGKNGSGKSSLLDLILMGIYNLSIQLGYLDNDENKPLRRLNFEMYWYADTLYKVTFWEKISAFRFDPIKAEGGIRTFQLNDSPVSIEDLRVQLFYTILVNYSHYALNSVDHKIDWITPLSHKNDGYITPLVINPKRTEGNIDINNEKTLLNMRLLLNLIELHDSDIPEQSFRYLGVKKYLKYFSIGYDALKSSRMKNRTKQAFDDPKIVTVIMEQIAFVFDIDQKRISRKSYNQELSQYLVTKLVTIVDRYASYQTKFKRRLEDLIHSDLSAIAEEFDMGADIALEMTLIDILMDIKDDPSHITLKFKQAVHYLKYSVLSDFIDDAIKNRRLIELDRYEELTGKIIDNDEGEGLTVAQLLPPAIFKLDFYLGDVDKSNFSKASSGEFQLISVLSSILYHLRNIDSVEEVTKYNYVTILLDEIELYFHPNMQRFFIKKLLEALSKIDVQLYGVHVLFATHSPFILSDIQQQKILKLSEGKIQDRENGYNTFAANMHDLLADEFFLDEGFMGAFAQKQIETTINLLNYLIANNELQWFESVKKSSIGNKNFLKAKLENEVLWYKEELKRLGYPIGVRMVEENNIEELKSRLSNRIEIIGEPIIKEKLDTLYRAAFPDDAR